jgi:tripartite-type tricarboxylate transporter receptor subunit TctC
MKRLLAFAFTAMAVTGFAQTPARAVDFTGKNIEWIIPFGPGGGSAAWAQFLAPQLAQALPGKPNIVIKYVPGGGSTKGANLFAARAKPDGLTILGTSGSTQFPYLLGDKRVQYEYKDWNVVMGSPTGGVFYVSPKLGLKGPQDMNKLKGKSVKYASQSPTALDLVPLLALEMMGLPTKAVFGMKSRGAGRLAFERGEVNVDYQTSSAYIKNVTPLVKEGKAVPLWSWGGLADMGELARDPTFPDVPHWAEAYEMMHGKKPRGPAMEAYKAFVAAGFGMQKMLFLPKGTPKDIVDAYRAAAKQVVSAPDFAKKAQKVLGDYKQVVAKEAEAGLKTAITVSPKSKEWVRDWLTKRYKVKF